MGESTSRILIRATVRRYIRQMRDAPERSIRNLLDMALELADGRFQQDIFGMMRRMLETPESAYYSLIQDITRHVDEERLLTYGINVGYNGCTVGAATIRSIEAKENYSIPWTIPLQLGDSIAREQYHSLIRQGERLGIYHWYLFSNGHGVECIDLAAQFPECAFTVFCTTAEVSRSMVDFAGEQRNVMLAVEIDEDAQTACALLREAGLLYSVYMQYDERDLPAMASGDLFCEMEQLHPSFSGFLSRTGVAAEAREQAYRHIHTARMAQGYGTILWELHRDHLAVDRIISNDGCCGGFDACGSFHIINADGTAGQAGSIYEPLDTVLRRAFPK